MRTIVLVFVAVVVSVSACGSSSPNCGDVSCPTGMYCFSIEFGEGSCRECPTECANGGDSGSYQLESYPKGNVACQNGFVYTTDNEDDGGQGQGTVR